MTRWFGSGIVVAVLAASAAIAPACKGGGSASAQQVVAGAPAGDVTEISGEVHATRDGKTRTIAKGDVVSGDDVIATGGDGRITIVLRHNHVPWVLGPNKEKKVADSAAWSAAAGASGEQVSDDHSTAAGRHAERSATDTGVSANAAPAAAATEAAPAAPAPAPGAAVEANEAAPPPPTTASPPPPVAQPAAPPSESRTRRAPSAPPAAPSGSSGATADDLANALGDSGGLAGASNGGDIGSLKSGGGGVSAGAPGGAPGGYAPGGTGTVGGGVPSHVNGPTPRITLGEITSKGGLTTDVAARMIRARTGMLRMCYQRALQQNPSLAGLLDLALEVGKDGAVTDASVDGPAELSDAEACMKRGLMNLRFPESDKTSHVSAKVVLAPVSP
jgi:hypothetical protein